MHPQTKKIRSTELLPEPLDNEQLAPWLSESLGVAVTTDALQGLSSNFQRERHL
jgi:hypothetical protein